TATGGNSASPGPRPGGRVPPAPRRRAARYSRSPRERSGCPTSRECASLQGAELGSALPRFLSLIELMVVVPTTDVLSGLRGVTRRVHDLLKAVESHVLLAWDPQHVDGDD